MIKFILFVTVIFMVFSCSDKPKELSLKDFEKYVYSEESGLTVVQELSDYKFSLSYNPLEEVMGYKQKHFGEKYDPDTTVYTFKLRVERNDGKDVIKTGLSEKGQMYYRLEYLTRHIQNDISLIGEKDTLKCLTTQYEYFEGITPFVIVNCTFKKNNDEKFIVKLKDQIWTSDYLNFTFDNKDIIELPKIK